jgi:hypothetical protein
MHTIFRIGVILVSVAAIEGRIFWKYEQIVVNEGESVAVTCTATDLDFLTVIRVQLIASDGSVQTLAESTNVKAPFSRLARYSFNYTTHDDVGYMTVFYAGISSD